MLQSTMSMLLLLMSGSLPPAVPAFQLEQVAAGVYVHQGVHEDMAEGYHGDICNLSFIVGSKGVAVIDSGGSLQVGQALRSALRKVTPLPILYVINTHVHPDHVFGNAAFLEDKPQFVGHARLAHAMELRKQAYLRSNAEWLGADFMGSELIKPTLSVDDELVLDLGDRQLQLRAYPVAHTNTDLTIVDSKSGILWTGDLLFVERTPSIDGDIKGWLKVMEQLKAMAVPQAVPGHGPLVSDWPAALLAQERYLSTLLRDVRNSIRQGVIMEQAMQDAAKSERRQWLLFESVNRRNVNFIYPVLEWE